MNAPPADIMLVMKICFTICVHSCPGAGLRAARRALQGKVGQTRPLLCKHVLSGKVNGLEIGGMVVVP